MSEGERILLFALALGLLLPPVAGCIGDATDTSDGTGSQPPEDPASTPSSGTGGVRTLASSNGSVPFLGLAVYDGIEPERVEPLVPGNMTPIPCFQPNQPDTVDVTLIAVQRSYEAIPDDGEPVAELGLVGCAERPDELSREASNEVAWVGLMGWADNEAYTGFLGSIGFPNTSADVTFQETPDGYTVSAQTNRTGIVDARFTTSPIGVPGAPFYSCEPSTQNGRSIVEAPDGSLAALDWNKTEAICPAGAEITWPDTSPLAEVLGDARTPSVVVDTQVEEARYWWRGLPEPGSVG